MFGSSRISTGCQVERALPQAKAISIGSVRPSSLREKRVGDSRKAGRRSVSPVRGWRMRHSTGLVENRAGDFRGNEDFAAIDGGGFGGIKRENEAGCRGRCPPRDGAGVPRWWRRLGQGKCEGVPMMSKRNS